jgi:hypothetical protein
VEKIGERSDPPGAEITMEEDGRLPDEAAIEIVGSPVRARNGGEEKG